MRIYQKLLFLIFCILLSPLSFATLSQKQCTEQVLEPLQTLLDTYFHSDIDCSKDLVKNFNILFGDPAFAGSQARSASTSCGTALLTIIAQLNPPSEGRLNPDDPCSYEVFDIVHPFFGGTEGGDTGGGY